MNRLHRMSPMRAGRPRSRPLAPSCETLEARTALSSGAATSRIAEAARTPVHPSVVSLGTISGRVTNDATGRGIGGVRVQLIDAQGQVARTGVTGPAGRYAFRVPEIGAYVVHAVTPARFTQAAPTLADAAPAGAYAAGAGNNSWNYATGNSNPANGPVGPASWATIAPAGNNPFESPIDLTGPTTDLGDVVTIRYRTATPSQIIDNGHQIQVQYAGATGGTIQLGGEAYTLSQFHYHDPSENTVDGRSYSMEEHFVNQSASGAQAVVAVFLQLGAHNNALDPILDAATASLTASGSAARIATPLNLSALLPTNTQGWFYRGSLTTPPLSGPVSWMVFATPITLDF